ncbi:hypothetical protein MC885_021468 [Smutsia gigantea]|nr:hypothetical protein MC885_021468 [Smutsia gigantea]
MALGTEGAQKVAAGPACPGVPAEVSVFAFDALEEGKEKRVEELAAVTQTLQADLETSIRRIADLQAALEEVASGDSDTER